MELKLSNFINNFIIEKFICYIIGISNDPMGEDEQIIKDLSQLLEKDASTFASDEELALHIMHHFNIDRDTLETLPAFHEPLGPLLWPEKKE